MIIDMHCHCVAPSAIERILANPEEYGARLEETERGQRLTFADGGQQSAERSWWQQFSDLEGHKDHLRRIGADGAALSTAIALHRYGLPLERAQRLCRTLNDCLAEWIRAEPIFRAMATLPLQDGPAAADELRRTVQDLHMQGAMIVTNIAGKNLDEPSLKPFWEAAEALDTPVFLHPDNVIGKERLSAYNLQILIGNPFYTTVAATTLMLSGVLDRHPNLKLVLAHGGGYLCIAFGRLTHGYHHTEAVRKNAAQSPQAYLQRFYYDTIVHDPEVLRHVIRLVGSERVLLGTDYPFNMEPPDAVRAIQQLGLPNDECNTILTGAAKLYGFE